MNHKKSNIFITLDYELFMGEKTGSVTNCMIRPLDKLIEILNKYNIKVTIFVDSAYLLKVYELKNRYKSLENDYKLITRQIRSLSENGHDIQLHIHPQWLHSDYSENGWKVDPKHYKLSDLEPTESKTLFANAKLLLEQIINMPVNSFRAGGYSIQTYTDYTQLFSDNGIVIDSSVLVEAYADSDFQKYDYRSCLYYDRYKFKKDLMIEDNCGQFIELPISRHKVGLLFDILKRLTLTKQYDQNKYGDGIASASYITNNESLYHKLFRLFNNNFKTASIDIYYPIYLPYLYRKHRKTNNQDFVIIGHPKNFSELSLFYLEQFIKKEKENSRFLTVSSIV